MEVLVAEDVRDEIAARLSRMVGERSHEALAEKMKISRPRLTQILAGDVPRAWLYLRVLALEGYDINRLLTGD